MYYLLFPFLLILFAVGFIPWKCVNSHFIKKNTMGNEENRWISSVFIREFFLWSDVALYFVLSDRPLPRQHIFVEIGRCYASVPARCGSSGEHNGWNGWKTWRTGMYVAVRWWKIVVSTFFLFASGWPIYELFNFYIKLQRHIRVYSVSLICFSGSALQDFLVFFL